MKPSSSNECHARQPILRLARITLVLAGLLAVFTGTLLSRGDTNALLQPVAVLDIQSAEPEFLLRELVSGPDGLLALGSSSGISPKILKFDFQGKEVDRFEVPEDPSFKWIQRLAIDESGNVAVVGRSFDSRRVVRFDKAKKIIGTTTFNYAVQSVVLAGGNVFAVSGEKLVRIPEETPLVQLGEAGLCGKLVLANASTLVAVDTAAGNIVTVHLSDFSTEAHVLDCPELQKARKDIAKYSNPTPTSSVALVMSDITSDRNGRIYAALSPYPEESAVVIVFNATGTVSRELHLALPEAITVPRSSRVFAKMPVTLHLDVSLIGVSSDGTKLFLYSQPHSKLAIYNIATAPETGSSEPDGQFELTVLTTKYGVAETGSGSNQPPPDSFRTSK